jgi:4-hydroxy-2-oxoheptanedioate aldolase
MAARQPANLQLHMRPNKVKRQLQASEPSIGTWLSLGSPLAAEQLAHAGFDWLNIEQEHAAIDATLTQHILQALSIGDAVPMVRVPWNGPDWIKRALDAGAYGLVIPMVNTREQAEMAVKASKYPPQGFRSVGGVRTRLYGGPDYVQKANDEIVIVVQVEHVQAVENAREILSVPGIDAYFVGPNDLCASMGLPPSLEPDYPEYWQALEQVKRTAENLGVAPGIHVATSERACEMIERGYQFVSIASDAAFMATAAAAAVARVRERAQAPPVGLRDTAALTRTQGY